MVSIDSESVLQTLEASCETEAPVSLMAAHMAISCTGKLKEVTAGSVVLELSHSPPEPLMAGDRCAVTFPLAGRSAGFMSRVQSATKWGGFWTVKLDVPERIQPTEQRMSVRIPVAKGELGVAVVHGDNPHNVTPIDLSLDGVLIEFAAGEEPDIEVGQRWKVVLKRGEHKLLVDAEVRRRQGRRFGLLFMYRDGRPAQIRSIVSELQHLWHEA